MYEEEGSEGFADGLIREERERLLRNYESALRFILVVRGGGTMSAAEKMRAIARIALGVSGNE